MITHRHRLAVLFLTSLTALVLILAVFIFPGFAATLYVGAELGDHPTIQDALDAAAAGDNIIVRTGTYNENLTIDKPGIRLGSDFGADVILDGTITVTTAAGGTIISDMMSPEGSRVGIDIADGIQWPAPLSPGMYNRVITLAGGPESYDMTLGDVIADVNFDSVQGIYHFAQGDDNTISHSGIIQVTSSAAASSGRGVSITTGNAGEATVDNVDVDAGNLVIGAHFFTGDDGQLTMTGDIVARARDVASVATGLAIRGQTGVVAELQNLQVEAGEHALGVDFNVADGATLAHSGDVQVTARDNGSGAYGVVLGAGDNSSLTIGNVSVDGGALSRGVTTTNQPGAIIVTDGLKNDTSIEVGDVSVTARDAESQAYGVDLIVGDEFAGTVGNVEVSAGSLARGVFFTGSHDGQVAMEGDITAKSANGSAHGILVNGGDNFLAAMKNVYVEGDRNAVQGVSLNVGAGGALRHEGLINVAGTSVTANVRGVNVIAEEKFSAVVGDVTATGPRNALGVYWTVTDGAVLTQTGTIRATTTDTAGNAGGATIMAGDELSVDVGDVEATAQGINSGATGFYVDAGHDLNVTFRSLSADGTTVATGLTVLAEDRAALQADTISSTAAHSSGAAYGVNLNALEQLTANFDNITVTGGGLASGLLLETTASGSLTHTGLIDVTATSADSTAQGVRVRATSDMTAEVGAIDVEGGTSATGISWESLGEGGSLTQSGTIDVIARDAMSNAHGIYVTAQNDFSLTVGSATVGSDRLAHGVTYRVGDSGILAVDGNLTATSAGGEAKGIIVSAADNLQATMSSVTVEGLNNAVGVSAQLGHGGTLAQTGAISALTTDVGAFTRGMEMTAGDDFSMEMGNVVAAGTGGDSSASGVFGTAGDDFSGVLSDVTVTAKQRTWGVSLTAGHRAAIDVDSVKTVSEDAGSETYGVQFTGKDDVKVTLGEVVSRAERSVWAVTVTGDEHLTLDVDTVTAEAGTFAYGTIVRGGSSTVTLDGNLSATTTGGGTTIAQALRVESSVAEVTNHSHVYASANNATGVGFGESVAAEHITFHNLGVVETASNIGSAVVVNVTETATVQNDGTVDAGSGVAFNAQNSTGSISLANTGTILGDVRMGQGADLLVMERGGIVDGQVNLGAGDDVATIHYGALLTGMLDGGAGDDSLTLLGDAASSLAVGSTWNNLSARNIEQTWVHGGAWQWGVGTHLGAVDVYDAYIRIDDHVAIADVQLHDGVLVGEGNVTGNVTNDGGIVSPGNSYGVLTIIGDYTQGPDGVLYIELDASTAPDGGVNYDQLVIVGGTAIFEDGTTVQVHPIFGPTLPDRAEYVIVDGDVNFDSDKIHLDMALPRLLFYDGWLEEGSLKLVLGVTPFDAVAETENQKAVGQALTEAKGQPETDLDDLYHWLLGLDPDAADAARSAYDTLSGEVYTHLPTLASHRLDRFAGAIGGGIPHPGAEPLRKVWAVPYVDSGRVAAATGTAESHFHLTGVVVGADFFTDFRSRMGVSIGAGTGQLNMQDRAGEIGGHNYQLGLYGRFDMGDTQLTTLLGYGTTTYHSRRGVGFGGVQLGAEAKFATTDWIASAEARFSVPSPEDIKVEPVVSLAHYRTSHSSFEEQGAGAFGLIVDGGKVSLWQGRVALELTGNPWVFNFGAIHPRASMAWIHNLSTTERTQVARLKGAAETPFVIHGTPVHRSGLEASIGIWSEGQGNVEWGLDYMGQFREDISNHSVTARIMFGF